MSLKNKTIIITGSSRGIGREIALRCAEDGANIVVAAKSAEPHKKLPGTIFTVAKEIEEIGGKALPIQLDVRKELSIKKLMKTTHDTFGSIDVIINNAGAISLTKLQDTSPARYDLMQSINHRAVYAMAYYGIPFLKMSDNPHILSLSPPINLSPKWLKDYAPYTLSKYGMTLLTLGLAEELKEHKIAANTLWPQTMIATAAIEFAVGDASFLGHCRKPAIMADAAYEIIIRKSSTFTGQNCIDEDILRQSGVSDFEQYAQQPGNDIYQDLFID